MRFRERLERVLAGGAAAFYSLPPLASPLEALGALYRRKLRPGQNTVEFLLLLAVVASVAMAMGILFHKKILGGIFTMVGMIIGAGAPSRR